MKPKFVRKMEMNFLIVKKKKNECLDDIFVFLSRLLSLRQMLEDILLDLAWNRVITHSSLDFSILASQHGVSFYI